ncbi:hypothetical protein Q9S78_12130 [Microbacterium sp. KSW-18]|uniref:Uncharacterized protein n=1 Tax=Microbacterium aquilitoris TaxID=3067307 RepID=A0ABU3GL34_9MICO|nr:hypothetical protein [Microbacterium sp. KSW-18]MDT3331417.1 hypothetical protein [Microbacterium sp. KSW-18]
MGELEDRVPPHEPSEDTLAYAGKAALSLIPGLGGLAAETLAYALSTRQAQRQHEFHVELARALDQVVSRLDETLTVEAVVDSDEFVAAVTRAQRAASETASAKKRRRLAASAANGGSWAPFAETEREQFTRLAEEFSELHVWLLHYFTDPRGWLEARALYDQHTNVMLGGILGPLTTALGAPQAVWRSDVEQAANDIQRAGLGQIPLTGSMALNGIMAPRTSDKGQRFLRFVDELDSLGSEPPAI